MRAVFSDRAYAAVLAETAEKITTETGGLFLGVAEKDTFYIIEAIDPGPKSIFEIAYFEYDQQYTEHLINKIANLYDHRLELIGLWHRHPGSFDVFSSTDDGTNMKYAAMREIGAISGLVNIDPSFRFTMYHVARPCRYTRIVCDIGDDKIPEAYLKLKTPERLFKIMQNRLHPERRRETVTSVSLESFMRFILPQLADEAVTEETPHFAVIGEETRGQLIDAVVNDLTYMADQVKIKAAVTFRDQFLALTQETPDKTTEVLFMNAAGGKDLLFLYDNKTYHYRSGLFEEAAKKAKEAREKHEAIEKERQAEAQARIKKPGKPGGVTESILRLLGHGKDEDKGK